MATEFPVRLSHPNVKGTTTAATKSSLRALKARGWRPVKTPADPSLPFDPSTHSVDEVNAYLADADETERARVLEAEKAGKNRATVKAPETE